MNAAYEELPAFHRALKEYVASVDTNYAKAQEEMFVGFEGSFGSKHVSPRSLNARNLGNLVCVEGIVTKCKYQIMLLSLGRYMTITMAMQIFIYFLLVFCVHKCCQPYSRGLNLKKKKMDMIMSVVGTRLLV